MLTAFSLDPLPPPGDAGSPEEELSEGQGGVKLEGWWLRLRQFHGLIVKRFHCAKRNTKGLFSQILLPAFFVCVAMTVALSVPAIGGFFQRPAAFRHEAAAATAAAAIGCVDHYVPQGKANCNLVTEI